MNEGNTWRLLIGCVNDETDESLRLLIVVVRVDGPWEEDTAAAAAAVARVNTHTLTASIPAAAAGAVADRKSTR